MKHAYPLAKPDLDEVCWHLCSGEFGHKSEDAFEKHMKKLHEAGERFKNLNGKRKQAIISAEGLWYKQAYSTQARKNII